MRVDITKFYPLNVIDTCSIWNILSSTRFYNASKEAGCYFSCTAFILYECLYKPRSRNSEKESILKEKFNVEKEKENIGIYHISIEDLQDIEVLKNRKNLSKGELSGIVFAKKTNQAFITDDQGARKLAEQVMENSKVQTTPQLLGWLFFNNKLLDSDKVEILKDHIYFERPLSKYFEEVYLKTLELRLANNQN